MRLTHIKLAGFKSFVDPTVIPVPAQLTGVVGPNGCGKSNVIDAVRWVLGESSAKHLRGESMQDVIFNGSATRKPASRASVELMFDNELGRAAGQWSQYAELSVKRVLERNGESGYFINNQRVRRRDVADLFLGTGVGARAYAIIEQGMISRLIEARPEELRAYLEEAAGVSKYKERRRETEARLKDARDNLSRVNDIEQELAAQLEKLSAQAEVARQYRAWHEELALTQQRLWLARKTEAAEARARLEKDLATAETQLAAETARLRQVEARLETLRQQHYAAQDALNDRQAAFYEAQSALARIEQAMQHQNATRERLLRQMQDLGERHQALQAQAAHARTELAAWQARLPGLQTALAAAEAAVADATDRNLPQKEEALRQAQQAVGDAQRALSQHEQARQVDETSLGHMRRQLEALDARRRRLQQEQSQLPRVDSAGLARKDVEVDALAETLARTQAELEALDADLPTLDAQCSTLARTLDEARKLLASVSGELAALQKLEAGLDADEKLQAWLAARGLDAAPRLWESLRVAPGWEAAVEAVLHQRLQALPGEPLDGWFADTPPARLTLWNGQGPAAAPGPDSLASKIEADDPAASAVLADWLARVSIAGDVAEAQARRAHLEPGACLVTPQGHIFTRCSVSFHGAATALEGVLARRRERERLTGEAQRLQATVAASEAELEAALAARTARQREMGALRARLAQEQNRHHTAQMERLRLQQAIERVAGRSAQIAQELEEITRQQAVDGATVSELEQRIAAHRTEAERARERLYAARQARDIADRAVFEAREVQRGAERREQEAAFALTSATHKISELENGLHKLDEDVTDHAARIAAVRDELAQLPPDALDGELQAALARRQAAEAALAAARDALEGFVAALRQADEARLACEIALEPLRRNIEQLRLKDQEALLMASQFELQLREAGADEARLQSEFGADMKPAQLQARITRLQGEIAALGAVNLAALEELDAARARAEYLAAQSADLTEAVATLENAIRHIDQESRARLKETFDTVNAHLGELFPQLFGGGQARLILDGEELLDAGVQLFAQPPGKKNASIQLLSGGEKALTALSLVFAMFKLNPAPFCLLDEVDAPLDDANTERYCSLVRAMSTHTQFLFITHNRVTMEMAQHLAGITMQEPGVSRIVAVDVEEAAALVEPA